MSWFTIHHHHYHQGATADDLRAIHSTLVDLKDRIMATAQQFQEGFARIDTATTAIAALIRSLVEKQQAGNMNEAEESAAQDKLLQVAASLEAMAVKPADPVPVPVPTP